LLDLPSAAAIILFGWQRTAPVDLGPLGAPGCTADVGLNATWFVAGQSQQARYFVPIPNNPNLVGRHFCNQAVVLDASAGTALGAVMSDAAEGIIGYW
jgi:hypothetical protein